MLELNYKESWAPKKWCFWTVVLEKTLARTLDCEAIQPVHPKGDQSWVHWKDWCWSWNSNTLATWCRAYLFEKTLMLGKIGGHRRRRRQRMKWLDVITDSMDMSFGKSQELVMDREASSAAVHGVTKNQTWLSKWSKLNWLASGWDTTLPMQGVQV